MMILHVRYFVFVTTDKWLPCAPAFYFDHNIFNIFSCRKRKEVLLNMLVNLCVCVCVCVCVCGGWGAHMELILNQEGVKYSAFS
jgi:hypothetical protein